MVMMAVENGVKEMENVGMLKLLEITRKLSEAFAVTGSKMQYELPQIAVVGCQSAGKSSVLENIVGADFLPRGDGVVTRCPLILHLVNEPEIYGEFAHNKPKRYTDFKEIRNEIENQTIRLAGSGKKMSNEPIRLWIHSPHVSNLMLIDLPGLIKNATDDQPKEIVEEIREMNLKYIKEENCLILAVSPANVDMANSDGLQMAKEVDEKGERTIGVLTKLDIMNAGTDACHLLENKSYKLRRGYFGVKNRSQDDINKRLDMAAALKAEADFFKNHPKYKHLGDRLGTKNLQMNLSKELAEHIRRQLPQFQENLLKRYHSLHEEISAFKEKHPVDEPAMIKALVRVVQNLIKNFEAEIGSYGAETFETQSLSCGSEINAIFYQR